MWRVMAVLAVVACTDSEPEDGCVAPEVYAEPGCEPAGEFATIDAAGCYEPCTGDSDTCDAGTCTEAWTNPCICGPGEDCCDACGGTEWLCL